MSNDNLPHGGMHASIFVKVWGDAGGGDAGRVALAQYAYNLGQRDAVAASGTGVPDVVREAVEAAFEGREGWMRKIAAAVRLIAAAPTHDSATKAEAQDAARWRYVRDTETLETAVWEALEGIGLAPDGVLDQAAYAASMDAAVDRAIAAVQAQAGEGGGNADQA